MSLPRRDCYQKNKLKKRYITGIEEFDVLRLRKLVLENGLISIQ